MRLFAASLAALGLIALSACDRAANSDPAASGNVADSGGSLPSALSAVPSMSRVSALLGSTGLTSIFDGTGGYTLLAPSDAAFTALGEKGALLDQPEQQAASAAILRAHLVPGTLSADDIGKAIDASGGQAVSMRTLGGGTVRFTRDGAEILVSGASGSKAILAGSTIRAGNNAALPIDAVLSGG